MANINRDYLIINDVKKSNISLDNGSITFYITDKNTQNIFVNLVINISDNKLIQKYANIENAEDYTLTMHIVKPDNTYEIIQGKLHDKANAIFEFDLPDYCCDKVGSYRCELLTKCYINDREEITTSNKITYKVKSSVLNDLDDIVEAPEYPLVIQLFDKLSDIEQYEEDRRANELARQLAEEQRQARFDALDADMTDSIQAIDDKVVDVENRISAKEQAVDKLIVDTKADINDYKVAKDQEIDEYKAAKDTEINEAIANQDSKIDTAISNQNDRITVVENNDVAQNNRLDTLENRATQHESRLTGVEGKNTEQDNRLDIVENKNQQQDNRLDIVEAKNVEQDNRLNEIEAINVAQNTRLDAIEVKNQQQDDRLLDIEKVNKRQDMNLKCLFAESKNNMIDVTEEGNSIYLQNSTTGYTLIDEIKGNTLVNCNKEPNKELILNGNINTSGDNTVTITEGVDGGLVDVFLEGNTLVNVSKTKDSTAITKAYTVENSGNHIALQGDVDGSCRPVIEGNTLVNLLPNRELIITCSADWDNFNSIGRPNETSSITFGNAIQDVKPNTEYTLIYNVVKRPDSGYFCINNPNAGTVFNSLIKLLNDSPLGINKVKLTTVSDLSEKTMILRQQNATARGKVHINDYILLEGDYTDKPIPDYFEGLQSSFEDNLVTQEMVDSGEEVADNLGKYKVDYKSTREDGTVEHTKTLYLNSPLLEGDTIEEKDGGIYHVHRYKEIMLNGTEAWKLYEGGNAINEYPVFYYGMPDIAINHLMTCDKIPALKTIDGGCGKFAIGSHSTNNSIRICIELSKLSSRSVYAFKEWLQSNPTTVVYQLAEPTYELIEQSNLAIPSYANGHLDFNTVVPVEKVNFLPFSEELTYLYANTQYTLQFVSDKAITVDITLGGTQLLAQNIVKGLNKIAITTPSELVDNKLIINGVGAKISEVVVTDTNREFGYFEGMKSVGECEELEVKSGNKNLFDIQSISFKGTEDYKLENNKIIINSSIEYSGIFYYIQVKKGINYTICCKNITCGSILLYEGKVTSHIANKHLNSLSSTQLKISVVTDEDYITIRVSNETDKNMDCIFEDILFYEGTVTTDYIPHQSNIQQLTHEPLRGVGNVKDRYVLIDGKWYIERNCQQISLTKDIYYWIESEDDASVTLASSSSNFTNVKECSTRYKEIVVDKRVETITINLSSIWIRMSKDITYDKESFKEYLPINLVIPVASPVYEEIDYNPLEVYADVTHITTNSAIPANITIKNAGFNCLLKPSTTYTVSSNLGLNTVTTGADIGDSCLRFYDTDTSDKTTMKDVLILEGDWTSKADLIPSNFSGIESCFEQELVTDENDEHFGKYKVNVKVTNEDKTKENNITFYINEPLRGIGDAKDRVYVKDDKVVVQRNCGSVTFDGSDDEDWTLQGMGNNVLECYCPNILVNSQPSTSSSSDKFYHQYSGDVERFAINLNNLYLSIFKGKLQTKDVNGFKQWLQQNPVTVVYQLAEPTYEEVEYNDTKLFIESFKNSTLFYNSNVPVTSKVHYSYSVPIVDTVAQTANVTDQQDQLIINLATQVAVLEMMTM